MRRGRPRGARWKSQARREEMAQAFEAIARIFRESPAESGLD